MALPKIRPVFYRILFSLVSVAIAWLSAAIAFGIYARSANGALLFLISSIVVFVIAWVLFVIPVVAVGGFLVQLPAWVVGLFGAVAGAVIMFALDREDHLYRPEHLLGFPALASFSGAVGMLIYRLLIEMKSKN
jgi:hypothetical protein